MRQAGWSWSCTDSQRVPGLHPPPPRAWTLQGGGGREDLGFGLPGRSQSWVPTLVYLPLTLGTGSTANMWVTTWGQTPPGPLVDCCPASACRSGSATSASWCPQLPGQEPWFSGTQLCSLLPSLSTRPRAVRPGITSSLSGCLGLRAGGSVEWQQDRFAQACP